MKSTSAKPFLLLVSVLFLLWILLTGSLAPEELLTGLVVAVVAALATKQIQLFDAFKWNAGTPLALIKYLVFFIIALIKANLDLARRILTPALPINPAMVEIHTDLQSDLGKLLLANSITLTPGTLTVDVEQNRLLVHWVDVTPGRDMQQATQAIAADFEQYIQGFMQ